MKLKARWRFRLYGALERRTSGPLAFTLGAQAFNGMALTPSWNTLQNDLWEFIGDEL